MLAQVGDAVEILAGGSISGQGTGALVPVEVLEGALVGLVETDHLGRYETRQGRHRKEEEKQI
jgi:triosephosphate isomerase